MGGGCGQCEMSLLQLPEKLTQDDEKVNRVKVCCVEHMHYGPTYRI